MGDDKNFFPDNCCGKTSKLKITDDARLLFADSQWWLQGDELREKCSSDAKFGFVQELEEELKKDEKDRIVLFMHHPLRSNGLPGGNFSWKHHLFPLTLWRPNAWVPLPGVGSIVVLFRKMGGRQQDLTSYELINLQQEVDKISANSPRNESLIMVGAHDRSLQLFSDSKGRNHHVVSGSAGGADFARGSRNARFVQARQGFAKLYFFKNREVWVEFYRQNKKGDQLEVAFRKRLFLDILTTQNPNENKQFEPIPDSMTIAASENYEANALKKWTFGDRYRDAWSTPVSVPTFNLETEFRHLTPVGHGGGMSSKSLRFEDEKGHKYVLRSVDKDVSRGLPKELQATVVKDFIQDLKSGSHPYGAFAVPTMANAAGIYHTNPRLYFLPKQERLGSYNDVFAGELYLFEERPDDDWSDLPSFGNSPEIISYVDALEKIHKSAKYRVDQKWALKSRLFDQFIHDYDRHDDQWRWATFPQGDSLTILRPIPRDRDQAFFDLRGALPFLISRRWLAMQQRGLNGKINDVPGEAYPGSFFDRTFLSELNREDWLEVANQMQAGLTDSVIENAFKFWPSQIYQLNAPQIISILKQRRDNIPYHAEKLYSFYAHYVEVVGTDKKDFFEVGWMPGGDLAVSVFTLKEGGEKGERYYHRIFKEDETREVRLFGLAGDDVFELKGEAHRKIMVRVIGGDGDDQTTDLTEHRNSLIRKAAVYDLPDGMKISGPVRDLREGRLKINEYDRHEFRYNRYFPLATIGATVDDGLLIGGGVRLTRYRFRKKPYGLQHYIFARFSANTNALNLRYTGDYTRVVGKLDFNPDLRFDRPIIFNYFGLGNDTRDDAPSSRFNWVRLEKLSISPLLKRTWYNGRNFTRFGPFLERVEVENRAGRITDTDALVPGELAQRHFLGFTLQHDFEFVEGTAYPKNGIKFNLGSNIYRDIGAHRSYTRFDGSFTAYVTFGSPAELTIATRIGAAALSNDDYLFYHSNNMGGNNYLRGFRNNRFAGKSLFYHNTDLRLKLASIMNHIMPFDLGLMAGYDYGRVWVGGEDSDKIHAGFSPGVWITPYKLILINAFYTMTNGHEDNTYTMRMGFSF